ncbi:deoxyribonuclease [Vibrio sp. HA2012]|uniref:TatD family hydrolase n=1 Tax=Vibrio sp. HA2012 TaxID=1971595 RepID=UPI000C2C8561|nr:TatD family hydrolase [Vibrio sp. HA2012]PJC86125.1 deoxyribonuclease [Vibrio sp. HA2012]
MSDSRFPLFDTHCHLDFEPFQRDLDGEISRARQAGVERLFIPSIGAANWERVAWIAQQYTSACYGLGMHPYFMHQHQPEHLLLLERQLKYAPSSCVAIGECGLDFALKETDEHRQMELFEQHIALAGKYHLPLILHCRQAHQTMLRMLKMAQIPSGGVLHGFSGSYQQAKSFVDLGFYIGVGGTITYPRANKTRQTISSLPLDCLLLETDAPDMPLFGYQGMDNHPRMLKNVLNELIVLRKEKEQTVASQIWLNSLDLF